jgi:toxin ParE1/3/4
MLDYLAAHSPQGARHVQARIQVIIGLLLLHHIGSRTDNPVIRRMPVTPYPYVVFYEATKAEVIIYAVRVMWPAILPGCQVRPEPQYLLKGGARLVHWRGRMRGISAASGCV